MSVVINTDVVSGGSAGGGENCDFEPIILVPNKYKSHKISCK